MNARELAEKFHEAYERLAPQFGYTTRTETRQFDPASANGRLMIAVIEEVCGPTLKLLAAAEGEEGTPETDIATMVTLCRLAPTDAADAIENGDHNDSDIEAVIHWVRHFPDAASFIESLHGERNALAARVAELEPDAERYATMRRAILNDFNGLKFLQYMRWPLDTFDAAGGFDAAIDAARSEP